MCIANLLIYSLDPVAQQIAALVFANSGQVCLAIKRIYVHEAIYSRFRDAMVRHVQNLKLGDGMDRGCSMGPVQNEMQFERVRRLFDDIEAQKWTVAAGGSFPTKSTTTLGGYFIEPTIIDRPAEDSSIVQEEPFGLCPRPLFFSHSLFYFWVPTCPALPLRALTNVFSPRAARNHLGPIVPLLTWASEEDVVRRANDTYMGLGASVWTRDASRGRRIAEQLDAGSVWLNAHVEISPLIPFGGHKHSGIGSEWGLSGLRSFCNVQALYLDT